MKGKRRAKGTLTRAYKCPLKSVNAAKLAQLETARQHLLPEARRISAFVERRVMTTGELPSLAGDLKFRNIPASAWAQPLYSRIAGRWASWLTLRHLDYARLVFRFIAEARIPETLRHELLLTSKLRLWHVKLDKGPASAGSVMFTPAGRAWARALFRIVCLKHSRPSFRHLPLMLDSRMVALQPASTSRFAHFSHWLRVNLPQPAEWPTPVPLAQAVVSAALKGQKRKSPAKMVEVFLPAKVGTHASQAPGTQNLSMTLLAPRPDKGRQGWGLVLTRDSSPEDWRTSLPPAPAQRLQTLALDLELATLIASSQGDLVEQGWMARIERLDADIKALAQGRQRRGLPVRCARYDALVLKLRHWLRSRVFAAVGGLIRQHRPETVAIERLDFRAPGLSRRMNRLLANFGQGAFRKWLEEHQSLYDFRLEEVNAAFSSQQCAACGYVDPRNRASQAHFECLGCGHAAHADVNAAHNLAGRSRRADGVELVPEWARPLQVFAWCWTRFVRSQREHLDKTGRIWAADATAANTRLDELLRSNPAWKKYGQGNAALVNDKLFVQSG